MARSGVMPLLLRLVPGASSQPAALAKRRLLLGLTVVLVSIMLQAVPNAIRAREITPLVVRVAYWLLEMLVLTVALSATYDHNQRRGATTARTLWTTVIVAAAVSIAFVAAYTLLVRTFPFLGREGPPRSLGFTFAFGLVVGMLHTGVWAFGFLFPYIAEDSRLRALEGDKLRLEADQLKTAAELARLRSELEPHFLLNTLNAISGLVTENPREVRRLIGCLGDLLRESLHDADELQPLEAEIDWLRRYAAILESRHAGSLCFKWEIDSAVTGALVPRLLLQPLVENAVKHGALRRREGGSVTVRAALDVGDAGRVICTVEDNGPGLASSEPRAGAFGLHSVRRRLELKFPDAVLRMESSESGTRSIVELPAAGLVA